MEVEKLEGDDKDVQREGLQLPNNFKDKKRNKTDGAPLKMGNQHTRTLIVQYFSRSYYQQANQGTCS